MAGELGRADESKEYARQAEDLRTRINRQWWVDSQGIWADSMEADGTPKLDGHWSVVFPMLTGVADTAKARTTLANIESGWINEWGGVHTRQPDISRQGAGVVTTNLFGVAAYRYGRRDLGWKMLTAAARCTQQDHLLGAFPATEPSGRGDFLQLWSAGPFLESIIEGLMGIRPDAANHRLDLTPQLPQGLSHAKIEGLRIGEHVLSIAYERRHGSLFAVVRHERGAQPVVVRLCASPDEGTIHIEGEETTRTTQIQGPDGKSWQAAERSIPVKQGVTFRIGMD